ncbi:MAG: hypothetical protein PHR22_04285 [Candidatus Omnitrophica bacterium]|nr:hypothetical protein [Candidatus Omnitrophota bacterium]
MNKMLAAVGAALYLAVSLPNASGAQLITGKQPEKPKEAIVFPDGSSIVYSKSKKPYKVTLSQPFEVQGIMWPQGTYLTFDESGRIRRASVIEGVTVQGINWPDGSYFSFTQAGKISYVSPGHAMSVQGKSIEQYERVRIDSSGKVQKTVGHHGPLKGGASADF